jgi:archaellum biogenesis protein FlaJ (TadC family)
MFVENLCPPAILYLGFSLTQIIIDLFRKMYNTAMVKIAVAVVFTTVLNMLCKSGLTTISWFIVFIPFVTMTLVTGILLYIFGLGPFTGKMDYSKLKGENHYPDHYLILILIVKTTKTI